MLKELRAIRMLLEKLTTPQPAAPPAPQVGKVTNLAGYVLGRPDAPLTMVEFTDLQCPFCRQFILTSFDEIKKNWIDTGKLRYISRDFPLDFHAQAMPAARAARCAGEQGKFWEMRLGLMRNANLLTADYITKTAGDLKLEPKAFTACAASASLRRRDPGGDSGRHQAWVGGTPTFVMGRTTATAVEGPMMVGALPYAQFDAKLKSLARRRSQVTGTGGQRVRQRYAGCLPRRSWRAASSAQSISRPSHRSRVRHGGERPAADPRRRGHLQEARDFRDLGTSRAWRVTRARPVRTGLRAPPVAKGDKGAAGANGTRVPLVRLGAPGAPGANGTPGAWCNRSPGRPGCERTPGAPGATGAPGALVRTGSPGAPGADGTPGASVRTEPRAPPVRSNPGAPGARGVKGALGRRRPRTAGAGSTTGSIVGRSERNAAL